jgi:hypothetical protein
MSARLTRTRVSRTAAPRLRRFLAKNTKQATRPPMGKMSTPRGRARARRGWDRRPGRARLPGAHRWARRPGVRVGGGATSRRLANSEVKAVWASGLSVGAWARRRAPPILARRLGLAIALGARRLSAPSATWRLCTAEGPATGAKNAPRCVVRARRSGPCELSRVERGGSPLGDGSPGQPELPPRQVAHRPRIALLPPERDACPGRTIVSGSPRSCSAFAPAVTAHANRRCPHCLSRIRAGDSAPALHSSHRAPLSHASRLRACPWSSMRSVLVTAEPARRSPRSSARHRGRSAVPP